MSKRKIKFTVIDFLLIISLFLLLLTFFLRYMNLERFNSQNVIYDADLTVAVKGIERENFVHFKFGDSIYSDFNLGYGKIGIVDSIRSNPAIVTDYLDNNIFMKPDFRYVDIYITVDAQVLRDRNGFYSISGNYIAPGMKLQANNGRIKFDCDIVSVKTK